MCHLDKMMWVVSPLFVLLLSIQNVVVVRAGIPNTEKLPRFFFDKEDNSGQQQGQGQVYCPCTLLGCSVGIVSTTNSHRVTCNGNSFTLGCDKPLMGSVGRLFILQTISHPLDMTKTYKLIDQSVWKCTNTGSDPAPIPVPEPAKFGCTECANFNDRIVGGNEVTPNEYPFMVEMMLDIKEIKDIVQADGSNFTTQYIPMCGGTIINKQYILGAANCYTQYKLVVSLIFAYGLNLTEAVPNVVVSVGGHDICDDGSGQKLIPASIDNVPCNYWAADDTPTPHDLWVIKLAEDLEWSNTVKPVCLPQSAEETYGGMDAIIMGWGEVAKWNVGEPLPEPTALQCILKEGEVKIMNSDDPICLENTIGWTNQKALTNMCARSDPIGTTGLCGVDIGSPLIVNDNGKALLVGVGSYLNGCASDSGEPDVFTRVSNYLDFIMASTSDGTC